MKTRNLLAGLLLFASPILAASDFEANLEKSFQVSSGGRLSIQADRGSIRVATDASATVLVKVFREVKDRTRAQADEIFAHHEVKFSQEGKVVSLVARTTDNKLWSHIGSNFQVRYEISIPGQFDVELRTAGGDITVGDLQGVAVARTSSGRIKLAKVTGKVEASDAGGDIVVGEAGEKLIARTSSGSIIVQLAKSNVEASNSGGDIRVEAAGGDVRAGTSSGQISLGKIGGRVDARNAGGDIRIGQAGETVSVRTSSGSIVIGRAKGKVEAHNSGGNIEIAEAEDIVLADTSSGNVAADFSAAPRSDCRLSVSGGGIKVSLPKAAGVDLDARASGGRVIVEMPITVVFRGNNRQGEVQGKIHGGGPALVLRSSSGDIRLKESGGGAVTAEREEK